MRSVSPIIRLHVLLGSAVLLNDVIVQIGAISLHLTDHHRRGSAIGSNACGRGGTRLASLHLWLASHVPLRRLAFGLKIICRKATQMTDIGKILAEHVGNQAAVACASG